MENKFSAEVKEQLRCYVYRLIDPRTGHTFYVGKGKGNRVFAHMKGALALQGEEDRVSEKIDIIKSIIGQGLEVIHVIHRHGLDDQTAFEVEAALIDAYPGLSNEASGHGNEFGPMNARQIQKLYGSEIIEKITEKCIIIKIKQEVVDSRGSVYEAVRAAWKLSQSNVEKADYVFAVLNGLIEEIYKDMIWSTDDRRPDRLKFDGVRAPEMEAKYKGKRISKEYRKKGSANPCQYANC